jgi:hypothetical protein
VEVDVVEDAQAERTQSQQPAAKPKRGGKRPGAGAPPGNMNALKHGRYSSQFNEIGRNLASEPKTRAALLKLADRFELKEERAHETTARLLLQLVENIRAQSRNPRDRRKQAADFGGSPEAGSLAGLDNALNPPVPTFEPDSIRAAIAKAAGARHEIETRLAQKNEAPRKIDRNPDSTAENTIQAQVQNDLD